MKPCVKVVRQLSLDFSVLTPIYFTFRNVKIHETVAMSKKETVRDSDQKPHLKANIYTY